MREHSNKCNSIDGSLRDCNCDGFHTFDELYEHRIILYIALCKKINEEDEMEKSMKAFKDGFAFDKNGWIRKVWCSIQHSDGTTFGDWFVLGINKEKGKQITYHLPARFWSEVCEFAEVLEKAPEWDEHNSDDVLKRLKEI